MLWLWFWVRQELNSCTHVLFSLWKMLAFKLQSTDSFTRTQGPVVLRNNSTLRGQRFLTQKLLLQFMENITGGLGSLKLSSPRHFGTWDYKHWHFSRTKLWWSWVSAMTVVFETWSDTHPRSLSVGTISISFLRYCTPWTSDGTVLKQERRVWFLSHTVLWSKTKMRAECCLVFYFTLVAKESKQSPKGKKLQHCFRTQMKFAPLYCTYMCLLRKAGALRCDLADFGST